MTIELHTCATPSKYTYHFASIDMNNILNNSPTTTYAAE